MENRSTFLRKEVSSTQGAISSIQPRQRDIQDYLNTESAKLLESQLDPSTLLKWTESYILVVTLSTQLLYTELQAHLNMLSKTPLQESFAFQKRMVSCIRDAMSCIQRPRRLKSKYPPNTRPTTQLHASTFHHNPLNTFLHFHHLPPDQPQPHCFP